MASFPWQGVVRTAGKPAGGSFSPKLCLGSGGFQCAGSCAKGFGFLEVRCMASILTHSGLIPWTGGLSLARAVAVVNESVTMLVEAPKQGCKGCLTCHASMLFWLSWLGCSQLAPTMLVLVVGSRKLEASEHTEHSTHMHTNCARARAEKWQVSCCLHAVDGSKEAC